MKRLLLISLFLSTAYSLSAQMRTSGVPTLSEAELETVPVYEIAEEQTLPLEAESDDNNLIIFKDDVFANAYPVNISPEQFGKWYQKKDGRKVWAIKVSSKSSSVNLIFSQYRLNEGVKLFIYNESKTQVLGAFTYRNNKKTKVFATSPIHGSEIIVEMQVAKGLENYGQLEIGQISLGFKETGLKATQDKWFGKSASCNVDINCFKDDNYQRYKQSVCRIIAAGTRRCTGTLINNVRQDGKSYVLTAKHCILSDKEAEEAIYYFKYESPECNGIDGEEYSISGSERISFANDLDFILVELSTRPPITYNALYAGWNATEDRAQNTYTIHHPEGDVKKIAINDDAVSISSVGGYTSNSFWLVEDYEIGTTEKGSSGSVLFDQNNRIIGTLTTGEIACSDKIDDVYQMFSYSWDYHPEADSQLKAWLDPDDSGILELSSFDPGSSYIGGGEALSNIDSTEIKVSGKVSEGWGYLAGHNSNQNKNFAELFFRNGTKYIYGVFLDVENNFYNNLDSKIQLYISDESYLGGEIIYEEEIPLHEMDEGESYFVILDSSIRVNMDFHIGFKLKYSSPMDTFALKIASPRSTGENTSFAKFSENWERLGVKEKVNTSMGIRPVVFNYVPDLSQDDFVRKLPVLLVYPNPTKDQVQIYLDEEKYKSKKLQVYIANSIGQVVDRYSFKYPEPNIPIDFRHLPNGLYVMRVITDYNEFSRMIIKMQ